MTRISRVSDDCRQEIRRILAVREGLEGTRLEALVSQIEDQIDLALCRWRPVGAIAEFRRTRREWLEKLHEQAKLLEQNTNMITFPHGDATEPCVRDLRKQLHLTFVVLRDLQTKIELLLAAMPAPRGPVPDRERAEMERTIAMRLWDAGVQPTRAADGTLGQIFEAAYAEIGIDGGADKAVRTACGWVPDCPPPTAT